MEARFLLGLSRRGAHRGISRFVAVFFAGLLGWSCVLADLTTCTAAELAHPLLPFQFTSAQGLVCTLPLQPGSVLLPPDLAWVFTESSGANVSVFAARGWALDTWRFDGLLNNSNVYIPALSSAGVPCAYQHQIKSFVVGAVASTEDQLLNLIVECGGPAVPRDGTTACTGEFYMFGNGVASPAFACVAITPTRRMLSASGRVGSVSCTNDSQCASLACANGACCGSAAYAADCSACGSAPPGVCTACKPAHHLAGDGTCAAGQALPGGGCVSGGDCASGTCAAGRCCSAAYASGCASCDTLGLCDACTATSMHVTSTVRLYD